MTPGIFLCLVAGVLGLAIGSFLNVAAYRIPAGISLLRESRCPGCDTAIAWWRNVPVAGWLALRGRCADCRAPISARYPLVEAITCLAFAAVTAIWWQQVGSPVTANWLVLIAVLIVMSVGITVSLIRMDHTATTRTRAGSAPSTAGIEG